MLSDICYVGEIGHYGFLYKSDRCVSTVLDKDEELISVETIPSYLKIKYEEDFLPYLLKYKKPSCVKAKYVLAWAPKGYTI